VQGGALRYDACKLSGEPKQNQATKMWVKIRAKAGGPGQIRLMLIHWLQGPVSS
jgi:hypothetical protein